MSQSFIESTHSFGEGLFALTGYTIYSMRSVCSLVCLSVFPMRGLNSGDVDGSKMLSVVSPVERSVAGRLWGAWVCFVVEWADWSSFQRAGPVLPRSGTLLCWYRARSELPGGPPMTCYGRWAERLPSQRHLTSSAAGTPAVVGSSLPSAQHQKINCACHWEQE